MFQPIYHIYEEKRNTAKHKANFDVSCQLLMYNQFIDI